MLSKKRVDGIVFPNEHQQLLIEACLLSKDAGTDAYSKWRSQFLAGSDNQDKDFSALFDQLDEGSQRLLPYLYHKYSSVSQDSFIHSVKEFYQQSWCKNQVLWHEFKVLARELNKHGISPLLTKGMALTKLYYRDMGVRPMNDIDIVVPVGKVDLSLKIIQDLGWLDVRTGVRVGSAEGLLQNGRTFINTKNFQLDFHWRVIKEQLDDEWIQSNWKSARNLNIDGVDLMVLHPVDQLIHTFMHGITWNKVPSFRWILDAQKIVADELFDMEFLFAQSNRWKCNSFVFEGLKYLVQLGSIQIDEKMLEERFSIDSVEKEYFDLKQRKLVFGSYQHIKLVLIQLKLYLPVSWTKGVLLWISSFMNYRKRSERGLITVVFFFLLKSLGVMGDTPYNPALKKITSKPDRM